MLRSLFSGISGLRSHQTMMDVTGNNIANVNTAGYKSSQTLFQDTLSQVLQGAGAPTQTRGGTNPAQVGLGVRLAGITTNFGQGAAQLTGRSTDMMISGDGFFVVQNGAEQVYSRAGAMSFDAQGRLVAPEGGFLQGWNADANGVVDTNAPLGNLTLPVGQLMPPVATSQVGVTGNLWAPSDSTAPISTKIEVFDAQGEARTVTATFTRTSATGAVPTTWDVALTDGTASATTTMTFGADGTQTPPSPPVAVGPVSVDLSTVTGYGGTTSVAATFQDGQAVGTLQSFSLGPDGVLTGAFSNGQKQAIGQIALATFSNPTGLEKAGGSMYRASVNSGVAQVGIAGTGGWGTLSSGTLEMSNVDLAQEFTNLIIAQRGFQANSRVITSSDELLQDLVNLKR
jgi:flagellar hook protein FlgE